jgi:hypothetical protein
MATKKMPLRGEYDTRLADMKAEATASSIAMKAHIEADAVAFEALIKQLTEVNLDVKSLLTSRAYAAGIWKTVTLLVASSGLTALLALLWRAFH